MESPVVPPSLTGEILTALPRQPLIVWPIAVLLALAIASALVGWRTRSAFTIAVLAGWYVIGLGQIHGKVDHVHHLWWILLILAVSPCNHALSLDSRGLRRPSPGVEYGFPVRAIWLTIGIAYFFAGYWKLANVGLDWMLSDNMRNLMWTERLARGGFDPLVDIAGSPILTRAGAVGAVAFELTFVVTMFTRARPVYAVVGVLFHLATWATMGIHFLSLVILYGTFIDWTDVCARISRAWHRLALPRPWMTRRSKRLTPHLNPIAALGVPLVLATLLILAGVAREVNGWPVASYPDFGARAPSTQSMFALISDGAPVRIEGLTGIEQHRLLAKAHSDESHEAALIDLVESSVCEPGRSVALRIERVRITDDGTLPVSSSDRVLIERC